MTIEHDPVVRKIATGISGFHKEKIHIIGVLLMPLVKKKARMSENCERL